MSDFLKGNYKVEKEITAPEEDMSTEARFEREALKRLGGSIAFVSKKKVMWDAPAKNEKTSSDD